MVSLPTPSTIVSAPLPAVIRSLPAPPTIELLPPSAVIVSADPLPSSVSLPALPSSVTPWVTRWASSASAVVPVCVPAASLAMIFKLPPTAVRPVFSTSESPAVVLVKRRVFKPASSVSVSVAA